jgi:flagellar biogenesis protein FliO
MLNHTGALWQYLGSFVLYTLAAVALIYVAYWYARRSTGGVLPDTSKNSSSSQIQTLEIESTLALEPQKTLYVIRSGKERFLVASSEDDMTLLSRLDPVFTEQVEVPEEIPVVQETPRLEPWYALQQPLNQSLSHPLKSDTFGSRFLKSVQWLVSSRMK